MLTFLKNHVSMITKLMINQLGMAIFGFIVTFAAESFARTHTGNIVPALLIASGFSILFYLFLLAYAANEEGVKDKIRIEAGRMKKDASLGIKWGLAAGVINLLFALIIIVTYYIWMYNKIEMAQTIYAICYTIAKIIQAPYIGVMQVFSPNNPIIFALVPLPGILATGFGYWLGLRGFMILPEKRKK
ncbi:MAG: hypothetical protein HFE77_01660 [Clostridiales bacterium]|nr:hypothetical protein [Clostridiales bacterium]